MKEEETRARNKGALSFAKFKREMYRDKKAIGEGQIYPMIESVARGEYEFIPEFQTFDIWDYGYADMGVLALMQRDPDTGDLFVLEEAYTRMVGDRVVCKLLPPRQGLPQSLYVPGRFAGPSR
jgi:hypothetical protein